MTRRELHWKWHGHEVSAVLESVDGKGSISTGGRVIPFEIVERTAQSLLASIDGKNFEVYASRDRTGCTIWCNGLIYRLELDEKRGSARTEAVPSTGEVRAPMAGKVARLEVSLGEQVAEHQTVLMLESMKMETSLRAPRAGSVMQVRAQAGDVVDMGDLLMVIE